jgi:hypothetical protein
MLSEKEFIEFELKAGICYANPNFRKLAEKTYDQIKDLPYVKENHPDLKVVVKPVKADFMYYIEVAEHMTDEEIVKALEKIHPEFILFSSTSETTENDEDWGHINIKPQFEWITFWEAMGYEVMNDLKYPTAWSKLLRKI